MPQDCERDVLRSRRGLGLSPLANMRRPIRVNLHSSDRCCNATSSATMIMYPFIEVEIKALEDLLFPRLDSEVAVCLRRDSAKDASITFEEDAETTGFETEP